MGRFASTIADYGRKHMIKTSEIKEEILHAKDTKLRSRYLKIVFVEF